MVLSAAPDEEAARQLLDQADADPAGTIAAATSIVGDGAPSAVVAVAARAAGIAARTLGDLAASRSWFDRAEQAGDAAQRTDLVARARLSRSGTRFVSGDTAGALADLDAAIAALDGADRAIALGQRAGIVARTGAPGAVAAFDDAIAAHRAVGPSVHLGHALANRGLILAYGGRSSEARESLLEALTIYEQFGAHSGVANVHENLGFVEARRGDFVTAFEHFDEAEAELDALGMPLAGPRRDHAEALLDVGLADEAERLALAAAAELRQADRGVDEAEAVLLAAHAALRAGRADDARAHAEQAEHAFAGQERRSWVLASQLAGLEARLAAGGAARHDIEHAAAIVSGLEELGYGIAALQARLVGARLAIGTADFERARAFLAGVEREPNLPAPQTLGVHHVRALLALADGDLVGARAHARAGMRLLDRHQRSLGAADVRAHITTYAVGLFEVLLRVAAAGGRPLVVLGAMEDGRARSFRFPPTRPSSDPVVQGLIEELRATTARAFEAEAAEVPALLAAQRRLHDRVSRATRVRRGNDDGPDRGDDRSPSTTELLADPRLAGRTVLSFGELDGRLVVAELGARRRYATLGPAAEAHERVAALERSLRRLATGRSSARGLAGHHALVGELMAELDERLLAGLRPEGDVVVVPTASMMSVPWALLPSLSTRSVCVTPSLRLHLRPRGERPDAHDVLVAGPRLQEADTEVDHVGRVWPDAHRLVGAEATAAEALARLDGARVAHVACHCHVVSDNPLFTSIELAGGPLFAHELFAIEHPPRLVVLSACRAGHAVTRPGNELLGFAAALLALGTRTLIAPTVEVPDAEPTRRLLTAFHQGLAAGERPSVALARAREQMDLGDHLDLAVAASFTCVGADDPV